MKRLLSQRDSAAVLDILADKLGVAKEQLTSDARLEEDLGADSLTRVEIMMAAEEQFHLTLPDDLAENVSTVGDLFEVLGEALAERKVD